MAPDAELTLQDLSLTPTVRAKPPRPPKISTPEPTANIRQPKAESLHQGVPVRRKPKVAVEPITEAYQHSPTPKSASTYTPSGTNTRNKVFPETSKDQIPRPQPPHAPSKQATPEPSPQKLLEALRSRQPIVRIPPLWRRVGAVSVDLIIGSIVAVQLAFQVSLRVEDLPTSYAPDSWLVALSQPDVAMSLGIGVAIAVIITNGVEVLLGRTLGKLLFSLHIIRTTTGMSVSKRRSLVRSLLSIGGFLLCGASYVWMLVDQRHRAWHDILTDTVVVLSTKS